MGYCIFSLKWKSRSLHRFFCFSYFHPENVSPICPFFHVSFLPSRQIFFLGILRGIDLLFFISYFFFIEPGVKILVKFSYRRVMSLEHWIFNPRDKNEESELAITVPRFSSLCTTFVRWKRSGNRSEMSRVLAVIIRGRCEHRCARARSLSDRLWGWRLSSPFRRLARFQSGRQFALSFSRFYPRLASCMFLAICSGCLYLNRLSQIT